MSTNTETKTRKAIPVPFEIYEDEFESFCAYFTFIYDLTNRGSKVPVRVLKKFFKFLKLVGTYQEDMTKARIENLTNKVFNHFEKNSHYNFSNKKRVLPSAWFGRTKPKGKLVEYNLKGLLMIVFQEVLEKKEIKLLKEKDECIRFVYNSISKFREQNLTGKTKGNLTHYKMSVITAHVVISLDVKITENKYPSNEDLFQSVKHALTKQEKLKS
jgi:hypothetical protein